MRSFANAPPHDRLRGQQLVAPEILDLEVLSFLRRLVASGQVHPRRARMALVDLTEIPLERAAHRPLAQRIWELRDNLTPYDAAYVALAEALDATLLTGDRSLTPGVSCRVETLG